MSVRDRLLSLISLDSVLGVGAGVLGGLAFRGGLGGDAAQATYSVGVATLSIVFSVFFTAMAITISASDDEFVLFLEEDNVYTKLVHLYSFALGALFIALLGSLVLYVISTASLDRNPAWRQEGWVLGFYLGGVAYSLGAVFNASRDALKYAEYRARFLRAMGRSTASTQDQDRPGRGDSPES